MAVSPFPVAPHSPLFFTGPERAQEQWAQCRKELRQSIESKIFERLLPTNFLAIHATLRRFLPSMVSDLYRSGGATQSQNFGSGIGDRNSIVIKVRLSETGIETLVSRVLGVGANKIVRGVVRCSGGSLAEREWGPIYAYAKCPDLSGYRKDLRDVAKAQRLGFVTLDEKRMAKQAAEEIPKIEEILRSEVEMASLVPSAVRTWAVWRRHNMAQIKAIGMEYIDGGDLYAFLSHSPVPPPCTDALVLLASRVCFAVAQAHRVGILHGDVKSLNVLLKRTPEGSDIPLLCDFGVARRLPSKDPCIEREATYAAPETLLATEQNPVEYTLSMDCWSLGMTVLDTVYGTRTTRKLIDGESKVPLSWERVTKVLREQPVNRSEVDAVVQNLMLADPANRWTAAQAADVLRAAGEHL